MRIAFLTSCLDPGCDGVGDYTTLLAQECASRGHHVACFGLADRCVPEETSEGVIRLSDRSPWNHRVIRARQEIARFAPDVVSVQFVCYGFDPRGLAFGLGTRLKQIVQDVPVHLMLHELWIGAEIGATLKHRLIGALQRRIVKAVIGTLEPVVIQTSNAAYAHLLSRAGVSAECLSLFGNIPIEDQLTTAQRPLRAILFGAIPPAWCPDSLVEQISLWDVPVELVHVGRIGAGEAVWQRLTNRPPGRIEFRRLGEQSAGEISQIFATSSVGIATAPWNLIGKSGSAVAMLEHGLPVIVNRDDVQYRGFLPCDPGDPYLVKLSELQSRWPIPRRSAESRLPAVASQFIESLERCVA